jgi:bifunctional UDP-N-acetylglucosamine pyrophosphorylase/glucosamine-1-phosphate N-acetyltransferase
VLRGSGEGVGVLVADDDTEVLGCNDRVQLAQLGAILRDRTNERLMRDGVTIIDPETTRIDVTVECERDAVIEPSTQLRGSTRIATGAVIGPEVTLIDTIVGEDATVVRAHAVEAVIGSRASVGPYAYLRPGAHLGVKSKAGTFVEIKNSTLGEGTKVPHLSYVGDATIGEHTNIGAANVFANSSGSVKSRTVVGSHVKTGSDTTLVAPVTVGDGAYTGAGAVIRRDVPAGALAFTAAMQRNIDRWVLEKRPGTPAAEAAERALDQG